MSPKVIVVGAGNAALAAALSAREAGAEVVVLEAGPQEERGGNSRFTGGLFRVAHDGLHDLLGLVEDVEPELAARLVVDPYGTQRYSADLAAAARGRGDVVMREVVVAQSRETLSWMKAHGVGWELAIGKLIDPDQMLGVDYVLPAGGAVRAEGEGPGLVEKLFRAAERMGVDVRYDSPAHDLLMDGTTVRGVRVRRPSGYEDLEGAVVLASGGFEANREMRLRYLGEGWDLVKVRGSRFNTGTMLQKALAAGAAPAGHWGGCHATPVDADAPDVGEVELVDRMSRYSYLYGLLVNAAAERFVDEGEDEVWRTYAKTGAAIRGQDGSLAFQVFDAKTVHLLEPRYETAVPVRADTLGELAEALGLPTEAFLSTVASFNSATSSGSFDPFRKDGLGTTGLTPPKSNWALPLDEAPFVAYRVTCGITFTYGGIETDEHAQVLDTEGRAMPGLYAAGEIAGGGFYFNYPAGSGLTRGAVFGRIAGRNAASGQPLARSPRTVAVPPAAAQAGDEVRVML